MKRTMGLKRLGKLDFINRTRKSVVESVFINARSRIAGRVKRDEVHSTGVVGDNLSYAKALLMLQGFSCEIRDDTLTFAKAVVN